MGPRKSTDVVNETGYPVLLQKLCKEEDVLIIPQFVTQLTRRQMEISPTRVRVPLSENVPPTQQKLRESRLSEKIMTEKVASDRFGSERFGSERFGSERFGSERFGSERFGSERFGSERFGSEKFGSEKYGSEKFGSEKIPSSVTESKWEDPCGAIPPPQVAIVYENPDDKDTPVAVILRNIYVEFALMSAIGKSLRQYPMLSCLKIENCCISREIAEALALMLAEDSGKWITDLSLDGNEGIADVLPLFLKLSTGLRYLSLERCSLDDEDMELIAEALSYGDEKDQKLQCLNLSMNKIGDLGVAYIAEALRTNRSLISLSLAGNQIGDEGAARLIEVLQKFPLTFEEIVMRRKRVFDAIFRKKNAVQKYLEELRTKVEVEVPVKKQSERNFERMGRRIRGADGRIRCTIGREPRTKPEPAKMNSGEKFPVRIRSGTEEGAEPVEASPSEVLEALRHVESELLPDKHPFINEVRFTETAAWCPGCWSLGNVNLAFNYLTDTSVESFIELLRYQSENFGPRMGLTRVVLLPGNILKQNVPDYQRLQNTLIHRNTKRETEERSLGTIPSTARAASSKIVRKSEQNESGTLSGTLQKS